MISFWRLALRNLRRNLKRNIATGSAIAFGFAGILLAEGYVHRVNNYLRVYTVYMIHTGHLAIFADGGFENFTNKPDLFSIDPTDQELIANTLRSEPEIDFFEKQIRGQGLVGNGCVSHPFVAQGYEPMVDKRLHEFHEVKTWMPDIKYLLAGRGLWNFPDELGGVLLSKGLALALGKTRTHDELGDSPVTMVDCAAFDWKSQLGRDANVQLLSGTWAGNISAVDGEVVGSFSTGFQESDSLGLITNVGLLQKLFATDHVTEVAAWLKHSDRIGEVEARLKAKFAAAGKKFDVVLWNEERLSPYYTGTIQFMRTMIVAVTIILAVIITLSVLNSATMTILERAQEIGMYRSMGFRRSHIRQLYLQECFLLSLIALVVGAILAIALKTLINASEIIYHPPGVVGGMKLVLVMDTVPGLLAATALMMLALTATFFSVSNRLRFKPAELLGGTLR